MIKNSKSHTGFIFANRVFGDLACFREINFRENGKNAKISLAKLSPIKVHSKPYQSAR